ncbi:multicopper oxidase domain-containing protein [Corynebacterium sp. zg912]|uniref:Multicopper oxidase CueO n=1 Tax=Corynebacterium wankanglinii TaxID=2735136 RepID=A0A7H0KBR1_9CORY|nr:MULTISPECIES: multicopper oxidase domain-containing protein [Corynebacterium]MBA1837478.1 multicopper oxidase domain-containing protein [Corynebacterium wankanglinii]MCR5928686.1 multicopper oxidase domain-containing protein [Corynebacterium sp. zg912]QNP94727.1 multicopper oxidase domain-containing protein [Corynebacterium wankanglinii]
MSRRTFFKGSVLAVAAAAAASGATACSTQPEPRGADAEARPLPIPPLYEGELDGNTRRFELTAQEGEFEIVPGTMTKTWGFNGPWLGPTLYMRRGEQIDMTVHNELPEATVVHWHGLHLPATADGGPALMFDPGESWSPSWTVDQAAATCWYHPHPHEKSALHAYRGLAGGIVLDDDDSVFPGLPNDYGVDDIPVIIGDANFTEDGQLDEESGWVGDTPLINGITKPRFEATTRRVRLRVLNGAVLRFRYLTLGAPFHVVATDQGFLESPVEVDGVLLSPGERVEIVVDLEPGKDLTLRDDKLPNWGGLPDKDTAETFGATDVFDLLEIVAPAEDAPASPALADKLVPFELPQPTGVEREFRMKNMEINGKSMDMTRVDFAVDHKGPEIWHVTNENDDMLHNFHVHNARFAVQGVENGEVEFTAGWHDTIEVPPLATVTLLVDIGYYPDPTLAYMYHCHMLNHEDSGMMGQFVVVEPGQEPNLKLPNIHGE